MIMYLSRWPSYLTKLNNIKNTLPIKTGSDWRQTRFRFLKIRMLIFTSGTRFPQASALGAIAPEGSPLDTLSPQESRTPAPINFVLTLR